MSSSLLAFLLLLAVLVLLGAVVAFALLLARAAREADRPRSEVRQEAYAKWAPPAAAGHKLKAVPRDPTIGQDHVTRHERMRQH